MRTLVLDQCDVFAVLASLRIQHIKSVWQFLACSGKKVLMAAYVFHLLHSSSNHKGICAQHFKIYLVLRKICLSLSRQC